MKILTRIKQNVYNTVQMSCHISHISNIPIVSQLQAESHGIDRLACNQYYVFMACTLFP